MEELKLILETLGTVSGDAKTLIIIYFVKQYVALLGGYGIVVFLITKIAGLISGAICVNRVIAHCMAKSGFYGDYVSKAEAKQIIMTFDKGLEREDQ